MQMITDEFIDFYDSGNDAMIRVSLDQTKLGIVASLGVAGGGKLKLSGQDSSSGVVIYCADFATEIAEFDGTGLNLASGDVYKIANTQVVGAQGAAVADATGAGDVVAQLNTLLARCRAHGLIAT